MSQYRLEIGLKIFLDRINVGEALKGFTNYNPKERRRYLTRMVILDELSFQFIKCEWF